MKQTKTITTQDFNKLCRFCVKTHSELKPIFKSDDESVSISNIFKNCLNLDVIPDDRLPLFICSGCAKKLMNANTFRQLCLSSYEFLIRIYNEAEVTSASADNKRDDLVESTPIIVIKDEEQRTQSVEDRTEFHAVDESNFEADDEPDFDDNDDDQPNSEANDEQEFKNNEQELNNDDPPLNAELDFKNYKSDVNNTEQDFRNFKSEFDNVEMKFVPPQVFNAENNSIEMVDKKYKGRGRPRKGEAVIKQKRIPKPHPLEMCQICGQLFRSIKTHMFVHDPPKFECSYCGRKFKHKPNLICHVKNHQNVRKFQCPHCPFKFQYSTNFKRHLRAHTGEKIFSCDICEKKFSRSGGLKRHKLTHDVPRVQCPYCEKMFTTNKGLFNHVGIHTGERPFKCKVCGAAFVASSSLCVHSRIHKKENPVIQCKECGLVVTDNLMLMNHMKDHQEISAVK